MTANEIVAAARSCLGTPFRHQGRQVGVGLDCAGFAVHIAKSLGLSVVDQTGYGRYPASGILRGMIEQQPFLTPISLSEISVGDLLLMHFHGPEQHLAVVSKLGYIMHAYEPSEAVVEHTMSPKWRHRVVAAYRFKDLTNV